MTSRLIPFAGKSLQRGWLEVTGVIGFLTLLLSLTSCGAIFDDQVEELDPDRFRNIVSLDLGDHYRVPRKHIIESFGAFGCTSCPAAEERLSPYIHEEEEEYNPDLIVIHYHSPFSSPIVDNWVTGGTEGVYNLYGYQSLPQVKLNGSNAQYGFPDINMQASQYANLLSKLETGEDSSWFELSIDTSSLEYDNEKLIVSFNVSALNRGFDPVAGVSLRALAAKNEPVTHPKWEGVFWEVIVVEVTSLDEEGEEMSLGRLDALTGVTFKVKLRVPDESGLHVPPLPPEDVEKINEYALIVIAFNSSNIVQNVASYQYNPAALSE